ncbi:MAG: hypothetical protein QG564_1400 [Campylobacterota bacterium]|nr:hypothetical protein [Campylobacterota bacterium]
MAIVVNKEEKRKNIALSCKSLLLEHGIKNLTISEIAKTAGIGKGTIYEYFQNKEDIVFEIMTLFVTEYEQYFCEQMKQNISTKEKIYHFLNLLYVDEKVQKQIAIYREFLAISLTDATPKMREFSQDCHDKFTGILTQIVEDAIKKGEILPLALNLIGALKIFSTGLVVDSQLLEINPHKEIDCFVETLFALITIKDK